MDLLLDTTTVAARHQFEFYCDALRQHERPYRFYRTGPRDAPFRAELRAAALGDLSVLHARGDPHAITQPRGVGAPEDGIALLMPRPGCYKTVQTEGVSSAHTVPPRTLVLADRSLSGWMWMRGDVDVVTVSLPREQVPATARRALARDAILLPPDAGETRLLASVLGNLPEDAPLLCDDQSARQVGEHVLGLLTLALRAQDTSVDPPPTSSDMSTVHFRSAMLLIERHVADPAFSAATLAGLLQISERLLYRILADHGTTFRRELRRRRLQCAYALLSAPATEGHASISAIALACGFRSFSHFSRAFRAEYGCSPRELHQHARHG